MSEHENRKLRESFLSSDHKFRDYEEFNFGQTSLNFYDENLRTLSLRFEMVDVGCGWMPVVHFDINIKTMGGFERCDCSGKFIFEDDYIPDFILNFIVKERINETY